MSATPTSLESARAARDVKRAAAHRATLEWQDAIWDDLCALRVTLGIVGTDPLVVFYGAEDGGPEQDVWVEQTDELRAVAFAAGGRAVTLSATTAVPAVWAGAVELWDELRCAVAKASGWDIPVGLVLDVDERVLAGHQQWYCPDIGPEPDVVLRLERHDAGPVDPFTQLLESSDAMARGRATEARLSGLLTRYGLQPPTAQGHEPGKCEMDPGFLGDA